MIPIIRHQPDIGNKTMPTVIGIGQSSAASRRAADGIEPLLVGRGIRLGLLAFQNGIGLRTVSPTTWTVMLEGAHARMTQSFRLRDRATRPVIQPDRTW